MLFPSKLSLYFRQGLTNLLTSVGFLVTPDILKILGSGGRLLISVAYSRILKSVSYKIKLFLNNSLAYIMMILEIFNGLNYCAFLGINPKCLLASQIVIVMLSTNQSYLRNLWFQQFNLLFITFAIFFIKMISVLHY